MNREFDISLYSTDTEKFILQVEMLNNYLDKDLVNTICLDVIKYVENELYIELYNILRREVGDTL